MIVKDHMTKKVITAEPDENLGSIIRKFVKYDISGIPVVDDKKKVLGIVTETDVVKAIDIFTPKIHFDTETSFALVLAFLKKGQGMKPFREEVRKGEFVKVREFMTSPVRTIDSHKTVLEAAQMMNNYGINRIPVVERGKLVGIIARADVIRAFGAQR